MTLSPPEQHALNQATLASVQSSLSLPPSRSTAPTPSSASTASSSSRAPPSNFSHSPGANPLLQRGKLKKAPAKKKSKPKPAGTAPAAQLAGAVERAQEEELVLVGEEGVDSAEAGEVISLADQLLAQLDTRDEEVGKGGALPPTASVPEEAVDLDGAASPKESHHEHHSSLGHMIKELGHDVKEAVTSGASGADKRPNRQHARKVSPPPSTRAPNLFVPCSGHRILQANQRLTGYVSPFGPFFCFALASQAEWDRRGAGCGPGRGGGRERPLGRGRAARDRGRLQKARRQGKRDRSGRSLVSTRNPACTSARLVRVRLMGVPFCVCSLFSSIADQANLLGLAPDVRTISGFPGPNRLMSHC